MLLKCYKWRVTIYWKFIFMYPIIISCSSEIHKWKARHRHDKIYSLSLFGEGNNVSDHCLDSRPWFVDHRLDVRWWGVEPGASCGKLHRVRVGDGGRIIRVVIHGAIDETCVALLVSKFVQFKFNDLHGKGFSEILKLHSINFNAENVQNPLLFDHELCDKFILRPFYLFNKLW